MSFESSDEEDGTITVHHLPWRSPSKRLSIHVCYMFYLMTLELNEFLGVLDKRADEQRGKLKHHAAERKPRRPGCDANTDPPENPPKWAVSRDWQKGILLLICWMQHDVIYISQFNCKMIIKCQFLKWISLSLMKMSEHNI